VSRSLILDTTVRVTYRSVLVLSVYLLFAGHNQPGGGFVGGLVAAAGIALRYVAGGIDEVRSTSPVRPWTVLGTGLALATATAVLPLLIGGDVLESAKLQWDAPLLGPISTTSVLAFDTGVYLVVVGLALMLFEAFGDEWDLAPLREGDDE
jgi:multisubunit Na+/H+ antiporter MnhB subunit